MSSVSSRVADVTSRRLLFVGGKGGVGKTVVSQAIAQTHAERGLKTLWVTFEDPTRPMGELKQVGKNLAHLNCEATAAFEEYASLKIGLPALTRIFLQNKLMRYLSQAAPGIHELVLLGKVWHERSNYDRVVVDMPSTGYGLAMFQSTDNFARLFKGGPIHGDAQAMLETFGDPRATGHLIVSLPEEMPLVESLELRDYLLALFPGNPPALLVNRRFPQLESGTKGDRAPMPHPEPVSAQLNDLSKPAEHPGQWQNPLAASALDYARKRGILEAYNLRLWDDQRIAYGELELAPPPQDLTQRGTDPRVVNMATAQIRSKGYA